MNILKLLFRRLFPRRYANIVAPLEHITKELTALLEQNCDDNCFDADIIMKLNARIAARTVESNHAIETRHKIQSLLGA